MVDLADGLACGSSYGTVQITLGHVAISSRNKGKNATAPAIKAVVSKHNCPVRFGALTENASIKQLCSNKILARNKHLS